MENQKNFWRKFNPTLKEMMEKDPDLSILGLWWSWYWRLYMLAIALMIGLGIILGIFS